MCTMCNIDKGYKVIHLKHRYGNVPLEFENTDKKGTKISLLVQNNLPFFLTISKR